MLTSGLKTPAVPTVTAGRVVTLTALTDPARTKPEKNHDGRVDRHDAAGRGQRDDRPGRGADERLDDVVDVVDAGNLVDRDFDGEQDDEDGDADVRREHVVRGMQRDLGGGAVGEREGEKRNVGVETRGRGEPDTGEYRGLHEHDSGWDTIACGDAVVRAVGRCGSISPAILGSRVQKQDRAARRGGG